MAKVNLKHSGAVIDQQIDRVLDGSVVVENTLSEVKADSDKPVSGGAVAKALGKAQGTKVVKFDGTAYADITPIVLSKDGDSLEMDVSVQSVEANKGYSFTTRYNRSQLSIGLKNDMLSIRGGDNAWIQLYKAYMQDRNMVRLRISYEGGKIVVYVNDALFTEYAGQKQIIIGGFGKATDYDGWVGTIGRVAINGIEYASIADLDGFVGTNTKIEYLSHPSKERRCSIKAVESGVAGFQTIYVKQRIRNGIYSSLEIVHRIQDISGTPDPYTNTWRLAHTGALYKENELGEQFFINKSLLVGAENEFAISFQGFADYVGGYHGYERIDLDPSCYVIFIADGKPYSFDEILASGGIECDNFEYREVSRLYASVAFNPSTPQIGTHSQVTAFVNGGYRSTNYFKLDTSEIDVDELQVNAVFKGLVCINRDFWNTTITSDGNRSHLALDETFNKATPDGKVYGYNGNLSAVVDSKLISTDVEGWQNAPDHIYLVGRNEDIKYYNYMPVNTIMKDGNYIETEVDVRFDVAE